MRTDGQRHTDGQRDEAAVVRFVEQFAMAFSDLGFPRMPARVLGALLCAEEQGLTAGELGDRLGVSPAAVSGAVRYLIQINLVVREPVVGSRRDLYRLPEDTWTAWHRNMISGEIYRRLADVVQAGLTVVDDDSPAATRLADMRDFFLFVQEEMGELLVRWNESRRASRAGV